MVGDAIAAGFFVVMVVEHEGKFLFVNDRHHNGWDVSAGRVEPGGDLVEPAARETCDEARVELEVTGLIRLERAPGPTRTCGWGSWPSGPADSSAQRRARSRSRLQHEPLSRIHES